MPREIFLISNEIYPNKGVDQNLGSEDASHRKCAPKNRQVAFNGGLDLTRSVIASIKG